jgi:hypothetical protein
MADNSRRFHGDMVRHHQWMATHSIISTTLPGLFTSKGPFDDNSSLIITMLFQMPLYAIMLLGVSHFLPLL